MTLYAASFLALLLCVCAPASAARPARASARYGFPSGNGNSPFLTVTTARTARPTLLCSPSCLQVLYGEQNQPLVTTVTHPSFDETDTMTKIATPETVFVDQNDLDALVRHCHPPQPLGDPLESFVLQNQPLACMRTSTSSDAENAMGPFSDLNSTILAGFYASVASDSSYNLWKTAACDACDALYSCGLSVYFHTSARSHKLLH